MQTAGARALREDDNEMSREAVLLKWEAKIEAAERREGERSENLQPPEGDQPSYGDHNLPTEPRPSRRFERTAISGDSAPSAKPALQLVEGAEQGQPGQSRVRSEPTHAEDERVERMGGSDTLSGHTQGAERRTITITGQPTAASRRRSLVEAQIAEPDRIALWAFLLGLFLVAVAAGSAHA